MPDTSVCMRVARRVSLEEREREREREEALWGRGGKECVHNFLINLLTNSLS